MSELKQVVDKKLPCTGVVIRESSTGGLFVRWHGGDTSWLSARDLTRMYRGKKRYAVFKRR